MFADTAKIYIRSGKGGDGHVSFRRELFVAAGGPNGGDGGKGGDLVFEVDEGMNTLNEYHYKHKFCAGDGEEGGKNCCSGKNGEDLVVKVPAGTIIKEAESGRIVADMSGDNKRQVVLKGGRGGKGNMHYATPTMQVPMFAQPGQKCMELNVVLELKTIADVGLVGFPNVGKSTFLSRVTNAKPKIANYHFTTLSPNLGVVGFPGGSFVIADIPGLIEGASEGAGLGLNFLKHIERTRVICHIVDAAGFEGRDAADDIKKINKELYNYNPELLKKPQVIAANKMDLLTKEEQDIAIDLLKEGLGDSISPDTKIIPISGVSGQGIEELLYAINDLLKTQPKELITFEQEYFPEDHVAEDLPFTVEYDSEREEYVVEGPRIEKMLGYTNLESEKGFEFFQNFLKRNGILDELVEKGCKDGDTVRMYGWSFEYYK
ncbi:MAG: GTPase ObgE [Lachnospiraceae bacterium]|nr:GTPase ObgE [Lachnospiraceae bacterium]